ncbi:MAG TPA: gamma-glutamyltransferase [Stellaceae bacterium]|nr:gamma-glutamyltransferase [Stellaceae bacterium]
MPPVAMAPTQNWQVRKPSVSSTRGIVAAQNGAAAEVGAEILAAGGTAVDAVVATAFALAVLEPWNSGLGGIGFMLAQPAGAARAEAVDFGPVSPQGLDPAAYPLTGATRTELFTWPQVEGDRNMHGPLSFTIPSAVRGYASATERFGRLPWRDLVMPAARLARTGLPVDWYTTLKIATAAADLRRYEESRRVWLPDGLPPVLPPEADRFALPLGRLAATLERLAAAGPDDFYAGDIAASIAADIGAADGVLSAADLAHCRVRLGPALDIPYHGARFAAAPGLCAGPTLAQVLRRLDAQRFGARPDAAYFTALVAALRQAYADRLEHMGAGKAPAETSTTHVTAIDRDGGVAALTTTLLSVFGSRYVLPGTGILMNNGVMWFDPRPNRPNSLAPNKRALTNMCPLIVNRGDRSWFGAGASGGRRILAAIVQTANFIVDFGMDVESAAHHPRIDVSGGERLSIDGRMAAAIRDRLLSEPGAAVVEHVVWPSRFACPNLVLRDDAGRNHGVTDAMSPWSAAVAEPE